MENPFEEINERLKRIETLLLSKESNPTPEIPPVYGIVTCSQVTGFAKPTIYRNTSKKLMPHYIRDGKLLFKREEIYEWMTENRVKTKEEITDEMDQAFVNKRSKKNT